MHAHAYIKLKANKTGPIEVVDDNAYRLHLILMLTILMFSMFIISLFALLLINLSIRSQIFQSNLSNPKGPDAVVASFVAVSRTSRFLSFI